MKQEIAKYNELLAEVESLKERFKEIELDYMLIKYYNGLSNNEVCKLYGLYDSTAPFKSALYMLTVNAIYYDVQPPEEIDGVKFAVFKPNFGQIIKKKFINIKQQTRITKK